MGVIPESCNGLECSHGDDALDCKARETVVCEHCKGTCFVELHSVAAGNTIEVEYRVLDEPGTAIVEKC